MELAARELTFPTDVTFGDDGTLYVAEAGAHTYGLKPQKAPPSRILKLQGDEIMVVYDKNVPLEEIRDHDRSCQMPEGLIGPIEGVTWREGKLYVAHRTRVSVLDPQTGEFKTIIHDLPAWGIFHNGKVIFDRNGKMIFSVSTQGNAGPVDKEMLLVMGPYNKMNVREYPGEDVELTGKNFPVPIPKSIEDPEEDDPGKEKKLSGVYVPLGTETKTGQVIQGQTIANGGMYRADPDGSNIERICWGLRNIFAYNFAPDGRLIATNNSGNPIPPREVFNDWETIYEIKEGEWYGWPDYFSGLPITGPRFSDAPKDYKKSVEKLEFVLTEETHRRLLNGEEQPIQPLVRLTPHTAAQGFVFGRRDFGVPEDAIILAEFGTVVKYQHKLLPGLRVTVVALESGEARPFLVNKSGKPTSATGGGGLERPVRVHFGPDGALYVVDFGVIDITPPKRKAFPRTGAIWKATYEGTGQ